MRYWETPQHTSPHTPIPLPHFPSLPSTPPSPTPTHPNTSPNFTLHFPTPPSPHPTLSPHLPPHFVDVGLNNSVTKVPSDHGIRPKKRTGIRKQTTGIHRRTSRCMHSVTKVLATATATWCRGQHAGLPVVGCGFDAAPSFDFFLIIFGLFSVS